jgi:putative oxidoreductase
LRLFSTFADGAPGLGLLVLRLIAGVSLLLRGLKVLQPIAIHAVALHVLLGALGLLLLAGFGTPIAGMLVVVIELWRAFSQSGDPWIDILLAGLGAALALLGPGAWSVDARLFGWKRLEIPRRDRNI